MPEVHVPREKLPSLNAVKHGCCATRFSAKSPVLPGEDEAHWQEVETAWFTEYDPQTPISRVMVGEAALAYWFMARNRLQFEKVNYALSEKQSLDWTDEDHLTYSRFLRYKTASDRTFSTAFKNLEYLRKARLSEEAAVRRIESQLHELHLKNIRDNGQLELDRARWEFDRQQRECLQGPGGKARPAPPEKTPPEQHPKETFDLIEQWVEVTVVDGVTQTSTAPPTKRSWKSWRQNTSNPKPSTATSTFPSASPPSTPGPISTSVGLTASSA